MNRQPTLLPMSIGNHKIQVAKTSQTDTIDLNVIASGLYNFDFDGDEMNAYFISNLPSIAESKFISAINTRIISYVNGKMSVQQTQDSVIGGYLITKDDIKLDQMFISRLHKNGRLFIDQLKYTDAKGFTTGKDCLSLNFPNLSYKENTNYYNKEYDKFINYKDSDKQLDI